MPAAPLDPVTGPDAAPASLGSRAWLTIGAGLLLFVLVPFALLGSWFESVATEAVYASSPQWLLAGIARVDSVRFTAWTTLANLGVSAAYALAGATASSTGSILPAIGGAVV